jgi:hypothetical protein
LSGVEVLPCAWLAAVFGAATVFGAAWREVGRGFGAGVLVAFSVFAAFSAFAATVKSPAANATPAPKTAVRNLDARAGNVTATPLGKSRRPQKSHDYFIENVDKALKFG